MEDKLNNNSLWLAFGAYITKGRDEILRYPKRKASNLSYNWPEENGLHVDLSAPRFEDRDVPLEIAIEADNYEDFHAKYEALFAELSKPGLQLLYLTEFQKTFSFYYKDCPSYKMITPLRGGEIGAKLQIIITIPTETIQTERIINGNG